MVDTDLDEGQKKFIQAAGISTAEFLKLKEVYEKESAACLSAAPKHHDPLDPNRKTLQMLAEKKPTEESLGSIQRKEDPSKKLAQSPVPYSPKKQLTKEIVEIAKKQGDSLDDDSLKQLDEVLYTAMVPKGSPISHVKNASSVAKDLADLGKVLFKKYEKHLGAFGAVATLLKDILTWGEPEKKDPVLQEIDVLKSQLNVLSSKMEVQFNELKAFIVEQSFFTNFADNATALYDYMVRTLGEFGEASQDDFKKHYNTIDPELCVTKLLIMLERETSNPLKASMKGAELPLKAIFDKWRDVIDCTLTQFLLLEDFASGLLHPGNDRKIKIMIEKIARFTTLVNQWEKEYLDDRNYMDRISAFVKRIQLDNHYPTDEDKAEVIHNNVSGMLTRDTFYVVVLDKEIFYRYKCSKEDQLILSTDTGDFNVFVFSLHTHEKWKVENFREKLGVLKKFNVIEPSIFIKLSTARNQWVSSKFNQLEQKVYGYGFFMAAGSDAVATRWPKDVDQGHCRYDVQLKCHNFTSATYNLYFLATEP